MPIAATNLVRRNIIFSSATLLSSLQTAHEGGEAVPQGPSIRSQLNKE